MLHGAAFAAALAAEWELFRRVALPPLAWVPPRWSDQVQYLTEAYRTYDGAAEAGTLRGMLAGVWHALALPSAQGGLHPILALAAFAAHGPSRAAALTVGMAAFAALQTASFAAAWKITSRPALAWAGAAFMGVFAFPWSGGPGSLADFRLDWLAACTYGIALAAVIRSREPGSAGGSIAAGVAIGIALLTRFLTAAYLTLAFAALLGFTAVAKWRFARPRAARPGTTPSGTTPSGTMPSGTAPSGTAPSATAPSATAPPATRGPAGAGPRISHLLLAATTALVIAAPVFVARREVIASYYWVGHVTGPEGALRDSHLGPLDSLRWIFREIVLREVGPAAFMLYAATAGALLLLGRLRRFQRPESERRSPERPASSEPVVASSADGAPDGADLSAPPNAANASWAPAVAAFAAPAVVLYLHPVKTPEPLAIVCAPVAWLALLTCERLSRRLKPAVAAGVFSLSAAAGAAIVAALACRPTYAAATAADARAVNALVDYLCYRSEEAGLTAPRIAVSMNSDSLSPRLIDLVAYERHGAWLHVEQTLPTGLLAPAAEVPLRQIAGSDFVLLMPASNPVWPYDRDMASRDPQLRAWCQSHLKPVAEVPLGTGKVALFENPALASPPPGAPELVSRYLRTPPPSSESTSAMPPSPPLLRPSAGQLWPAHADFTMRLEAIYGPVRTRASGLPDGLRVDGRTAEIRGHTDRIGEFRVRLALSNASGTTDAAILLKVVDAPFAGSVSGPPRNRAGEPCRLEFEAMDASGHLVFIDFTDQLTGRLLDRVPAGPADRFHWRSSFTFTPAGAGIHPITLRIVRNDPAANPPYTFIDEGISISVGK